MADRHEAGEEHELEPQELMSEEEILLHFGRYAEGRAALSWKQRTFKENLMHYLDRIFLAFLVIFILFVILDIAFKIWYVTHWGKIWQLLRDTVSYFFMQEDDEELFEL